MQNWSIHTVAQCLVILRVAIFFRALELLAFRSSCFDQKDIFVLVTNVQPLHFILNFIKVAVEIETSRNVSFLCL